MGKEPAEVKQEIEQTRAELGEDVDTLREQVNKKGGVKGVAGEAASKASHTARSEAEKQAKKKLQSASEEAKKKFEAVSQVAKQQLASTSELAKKEFESAPATAKKALKSAPHAAKAAKQKTEQHPVAGIMIAIGTGWLLRSLMKPTRRSSRSRAEKAAT